MSTSTTGRSPFARTLRFLLGTNLVVAAWFGVVVLVLWGGAVVVAAVVTGGDVEISVAQFARQGTIWFPFAMAIAVFGGHHVPHIAAGLTRRVLARATLVLVAVMTVVYTAVIAVLLAVESAVYTANGWEQWITEDAWSPVLPMAAVILLHAAAVAAGQVGGLLVAVVYQRFGAWRGTLALPLTAGPLVVVVAATSGDVPMRALDALGGPVAPGLVARLALGVVVVAVTAAAYASQVRRVALRPVRT